MWQDLQPDDPGRIGPYRLRGVLGSGGMGRVFLGASADGQLVAVKVIRAAASAAGGIALAASAHQTPGAHSVSGHVTSSTAAPRLPAPPTAAATAATSAPPSAGATPAATSPVVTSPSASPAASSSPTPAASSSPTPAATASAPASPAPSGSAAPTPSAVLS